MRSKNTLKMIRYIDENKNGGEENVQTSSQIADVMNVIFKEVQCCYRVIRGHNKSD